MKGAEMARFVSKSKNGKLPMVKLKPMVNG